MIYIFKNLIIFYFLLGVPLFLLILLGKYTFITPAEFALGIAVYIFIYHPMILGLRLIATSRISNSEFWKTFIPFWNMKYFGFLFFNRQKSF